MVVLADVVEVVDGGTYKSLAKLIIIIKIIVIIVTDRWNNTNRQVGGIDGRVNVNNFLEESGNGTK